jgi:hypothetical protein
MLTVLQKKLALMMIYGSMTMVMPIALQAVACTCYMDSFCWQPIPEAPVSQVPCSLLGPDPEPFSSLLDCFDHCRENPYFPQKPRAYMYGNEGFCRLL